MKVSISLNFSANTIGGEYYIKTFKEYVNFNPSRIAYKKSKIWKDKNWNEKRHLKFIEDCDKDSSLIISNKGNLFYCGLTGSDTPNLSIEITQNYLNFDSNTINLNKSIVENGFVSAYIYNEDYVHVQSTQFASNIKGLNIPVEILSTIKNTPYRIEYGTGFKIYDIKHNPGRKELIGYTWLIPAWKMWFGKGFYHLVSKEKILSFKDALEIKELENDIVYVHLFEKIEESWTKENMEKQWAWREWLDYDNLIKTYP